MTRLTIRASLVCLAVLITACSSSPTVRYFSLEPASHSAYSGDADVSRIVVLGPISTPDYLKRLQIVTRGQGSEVMVDDFSRWVEPVENAIHGVVSANVDASLPGTVVVAFPYAGTVDAAYYVVGRIDRFDTDQSGRTLLLVQWAIADARREITLAPRRGNYETRASDPGDPASVVRAMNQALEEFSQDVTGQLRQLIESETTP